MPSFLPFQGTSDGIPPAVRALPARRAWRSSRGALDSTARTLARRGKPALSGLFVLALLALPWIVTARDEDDGGGKRIRKCVDAQGQVSYQGSPCAAQAAERWSAPLLPESPEQAARAKRATEELARNMPAPRDARRTASRGVRVAPGRPRVTVTPCDLAQRKAAEERERDWYRIKFDRLRQLDEWVRSQCAD